MEVNREWWDGTTREIYATSTIGDTPVVVTLQNLSSKITTNLSKYEGVEWDKSICPWKINHNSDFFKKQWDNCYFNNNALVVSQSPLFKERKKGYTFYLSCAGGDASFQPHENVNALSPMVPQYLNCLSRPNIDLNNTPEYDWINDKYRCNFPVINFDYSRICAAIMIHDNDGRGHLLSENDRSRWDASGVTGLSVMFFTKDTNSSNTSTICMGIVSLNNEIKAPPWDTTNCWNDEYMCDNGLALTWCNAWDGGFSIGGMQTLGTSTKWFQESVNNPGFREDNYPSDNVAGAIYYFPAKNIPVDNPAADDENSPWSSSWVSFYAGGDYPYGNKRYLKSNVTFDDFCNYCKQQLAYLGFRFCIDTNHLNDDINSQYFFIPEIDEKGVTTGNYYQADSTEAQNLPNSGWTNDVYEQTPYDGTDDEEDNDPNEYDESLTTSMFFSPFSPSIGTNDYLMTEDAFNEITKVFCYWKYAEEQEIVSAGSCAKLFGSDDPFDCINNVIKYPYDLATDFTHSGSTVAGIKGANPDATHGLLIGNTEIPIDPNGQSGTPTYQGETVFCQYNEILKINYNTSIPYYTVLPPLNYFALYGNFLDYAPYSSAELYVPFCGSVQIDPKTFIGNNINIQLAISLSEGTVRADICRGALLLQSMTGTIGTSINLTSQDIGQRTNAVQQANATIEAQRERMARNVAGFALAAGAAALTGGSAIPAAMTGLGVLNQAAETKIANEMSQYTIDTAEAPFHKAVTGNGFLTQIAQASADLVIHRPKMLANYDAQAYAHTTGFATLDNTQLKNYHGYTVVDAVDLSGVQCTEKEAQMIKSALKQGVYLP